MIDKFIVRDRRKRGYFSVDDYYLNEYAKVLGPVGTAVYLSLCRHVDRNEKCYPSEKKIAEEHGISDRSVRKYLHDLERLNLIAVQRRRGKSGGFLSSLYFLLDRSVWLPPESVSSAQRNQVLLPAENDNGDQRNVVPPKDTQKKETHWKDVPSQHVMPHKAQQPVSENCKAIAELLRNKILLNNPSAKITETQTKQWALEADLMIRADGRSEREIRDLIEWSQTDPFWHRNILSMGKLRKQFDRLVLERRSQSGNACNRQKGHAEDAERYAGDMERGRLFDRLHGLDQSD